MDCQNLVLVLCSVFRWPKGHATRTPRHSKEIDQQELHWYTGKMNY